MSDTPIFESCPNCGASFTAGTKRCPSCNTQTPSQYSGRSEQVLKGRRRLRHLLVAAILFLLPHTVPQLRNLVPYRLLFWNSPLVLEAVTRANQHPETEGLVGRPVNAGWLSRGYVRSDETGWSEGRIWIPVEGVKASGTLYVRGGQADSPWVFSELRLVRGDGQTIDLLAPVTPPSVALRKNDARIYLVPLGDVQGLGLEELPEFYRSRYGLSVELLDPVPLDGNARNTARKQLIFGELIRLMHGRHPKLAKDKSAFLIGITDEDMYIETLNWKFAYTAYDPPQRVGVVSSARFGPHPLAGNEKLLRARVRKMVSRTMGFVVFHLPESNDPSSVMYKDLYGTASADLMSDSFEGLGARAVVDEFRTAHGMQPVPAEILPESANFDYSKVDGRYPCLRLTKGKSTGGSIDVRPTKCEQGVHLDNEVHEIEIDLRIGNVITRTTDLFIARPMPLAVTRCYRSWDSLNRSFGRNATLSWDLFPTGSRQPYTYIDVNVCDGNQIHFQRISRGTGYADAVYEHRATATTFLGSRFSWNGNGWDLKLRDGAYYGFPESYYAKRPADGALTQFRDGKGRAVKLERGERRNLRRITSPAGQFITLEHDSADRIYQIEDDQKRKVNYLYDHAGRLTEVRGVGRSQRYEYASTFLMKVDEDGRRLVELDYDRRGRLRELKLADGRIYRFEYEYHRRDSDRVVKSIVTGPDQAIARFDIEPTASPR